MRKLKTDVGRRLQAEREAERFAKRRSLPASKRHVAESKRKPSLDDLDARSPFRCVECGSPVASKGLCGECACEDDGAIW